MNICRKIYENVHYFHVFFVVDNLGTHTVLLHIFHLKTKFLGILFSLINVYFSIWFVSKKTIDTYLWLEFFVVSKDILAFKNLLIVFLKQENRLFIDKFSFIFSYCLKELERPKKVCRNIWSHEPIQNKEQID